MSRQIYSLEDIKRMLTDRAEEVAEHYALPASGSHTSFGKYWTLNPGRADRHVGSFCVHLGGAKRGRWNDYATGEAGDLLDLIALSLGCDLREALREARRFLGLGTVDPAAQARLERGREAARARQRRAEADERARAARKSAAALALWLSGREALRGTPVDLYLRGRGIDLSRLGRAPGALRYLPECLYRDTDPETGEFVELSLPAMASIVCNVRGQAVAVHRTYLAPGPDGRWGKATVRQPKKVLGRFGGAAVNIWRGTGPRGGKPASLPKCAPGTHVYLTEGIEDALSVALLLPDVRVLAAVSLGNLGQVELPQNVATVTLVADRDVSPKAQAALGRAIEAHRRAGREVRIWQNAAGGKDLNDALQLAVQAGQVPAGAGEERRQAR